VERRAKPDHEKYLDGLPARAAAFDELKKLYSQRSVRYRDLKYRRGVLFAMKTQPEKEQPALVTLKSADDPASDRAIVDPNQIDAKGGTEIDFYEPSVDGSTRRFVVKRRKRERDVHVL